MTTRDQVDAMVYAMKALAPRAKCRGCGVELDTLTAEIDGLCRGALPSALPMDTSRRCFSDFSTHAFRTGKPLAMRRYVCKTPGPWDWESYGVDWTPAMLVLFDQWMETRREPTLCPVCYGAPPSRFRGGPCIHCGQSMEAL